MFQWIKDKLSAAWEAVKGFFKYSETILWARLQQLTGLIVGGLGALDWSPLVNLTQSTGFTRNQLITLAAVLTVQGIITEVVRRMRASL